MTLLPLCLFFQRCDALMTPKCSRSSTGRIIAALESQKIDETGRRTFVKQLFLPAAAFGMSAATGVLSPVLPAGATLMDTNNIDEVKTFKPGEKMTIEEAKDRFKLAVQDVDELLANYSEISKGGGDNVRRYLGTVGVKSHMYGITKVLKELREEADDIIEFTEASNEFEAYLFQAEGAAYQSLFAEHSSAKSTPESLLVTAKKDVVTMRRFMGDLAVQLHLEV